MNTMTDIANKVVYVDEELMKYMPFIFGVMKFTPVGGEAALFQPLAMVLLTAVDNAAKAIAAGNAGNAIDVVAELTKHLTQGLPNSPILSAPAADDPSKVGSG